MAHPGYFFLMLALASGVYALVFEIIYLTKKDEKTLFRAQGGVAILTFLVMLAALTLAFALVTSDFSLKYVTDYTDTGLPFIYKLSAFWAGNAGSLLLWAAVLALYTALVTFSGKNHDQGVSACVTVLLLINLIFFLSSMVFFANPFERNLVIPPEGRGLNPMLRNPWMIIHPVLLYLGYIGFAVPFAFAMAWLIAKRSNGAWIKLTRRWTVIAWLFLSLGNLFGAQWAYVELGWGGYWAWDPVENASFLPWLTGSAFLHSVMVQERRGQFKAWNIVLIIITYGLTLYGTFLVRSGILSSVHAFPKSNLGYWFGLFILAMLGFAFYLLFTRRNILKSNHSQLLLISKETSFLLNNILLLGSVFIIFFGTNLPLFTGIFTGIKRGVGKDWFNSTAGPVLLAAVFLMGICLQLEWRKPGFPRKGKQILFTLAAALVFAAGLYLLGIRDYRGLIGFAIVFFVIINTLWEFVKGTIGQRRNTGEGFITAFRSLVLHSRRRYGGYLVHLGLALFAMGVLGDSFYSTEMIKTVSAGDRISIKKINDYCITFQGVRGREEGNKGIIYADLKVEKNDRPSQTLRPEVIYYPNWENPRSEVAIAGGLVEDLYIILAGWDDGGKQGTFEIHVNPLMNWLWIGGYVLVLGTVLAILPGRGLQ
ncbi:MAG: heme lyase CcmF/NrfE family subunit [Bacillota bacterium]